MLTFGFIRGVFFGISLGLMSRLVVKKICRNKKNRSKVNKKV